MTDLSLNFESLIVSIDSFKPMKLKQDKITLRGNNSKIRSATSLYNFDYLLNRRNNYGAGLLLGKGRTRLYGISGFKYDLMNKKRDFYGFGDLDENTCVTYIFKHDKLFNALWYNLNEKYFYVKQLSKLSIVDDLFDGIDSNVDPIKMYKNTQAFFNIYSIRKSYPFRIPKLRDLFKFGSTDFVLEIGKPGKFMPFFIPSYFTINYKMPASVRLQFNVVLKGIVSLNKFSSVQSLNALESLNAAVHNAISVKESYFFENEYFNLIENIRNFLEGIETHISEVQELLKNFSSILEGTGRKAVAMLYSFDRLPHGVPVENENLLEFKERLTEDECLLLEKLLYTDVDSLNLGEDARKKLKDVLSAIRQVMENSLPRDIDEEEDLESEQEGLEEEEVFLQKAEGILDELPQEPLIDDFKIAYYSPKKVVQRDFKILLSVFRNLYSYSRTAGFVKKILVLSQLLSKYVLKKLEMNLSFFKQVFFYPEEFFSKLSKNLIILNCMHNFGKLGSINRALPKTFRWKDFGLYVELSEEYRSLGFNNFPDFVKPTREQVAVNNVWKTYGLVADNFMRVYKSSHIEQRLLTADQISDGVFLRRYSKKASILMGGHVALFRSFEEFDHAPGVPYYVSKYLVTHFYFTKILNFGFKIYGHTGVLQSFLTTNRNIYRVYSRSMTFPYNYGLLVSTKVINFLGDDPSLVYRKKSAFTVRSLPMLELVN